MSNPHIYPPNLGVAVRADSMSIGNGSHTHSLQAPSPSWIDAYTNNLSPVGLIAARMRLQPGMLMPWGHLSVYVEQAKCFVFVVAKGEAVTLEDDPNLFPSDKLITQLRLLAERK